MTLSEIAGRLLKGSGHSQPSPGKGSQSEYCPSFDRASGPSFLTSPESDGSQVIGCGGMIGSNFGEPRGQSISASSWAKIRPLSDIRELTEPSLADTIPRKLLSENLTRNTSRHELSRRPSASSRRHPSVDIRHGENKEPGRKTSIESNGIRSAHRGRSSRTPSPPSPVDNNSMNSIYSIPPSNVPPRSSSHTRARSASQTCLQRQKIPAQTTQRGPATTSLAMPTITLPPPKGCGHSIPRRGQSQSPVRHVAARFDPISHDTNRRIPSSTLR